MSIFRAKRTVVLFSEAMASVKPKAVVSEPATLVLLRVALRVLCRIWPRAASRIAGELFRRPRRFAMPEREERLIHGAEQLMFSFGELTRIAAWRWGRGPAVILTHGWEGRGAQMAAFAEPLVAAGFSVIAFDAPGHGQSSGSDSSLPHFAWALRRVAAEIGGAHAVVGHSLGCAAATVALRDGLAVKKVVYVAPPLNPADYMRQFGAMFNLTDRVIHGLRERVEERFLRLWSDYSLAAAAPAMRVPLLVIHDTDDEDTAWSGGAKLVELWPGAELLTTSGLGHRRILRDDAVVQAATAFIAGTRPASASPLTP